MTKGKKKQQQQNKKETKQECKTYGAKGMTIKMLEKVTKEYSGQGKDSRDKCVKTKKRLLQRKGRNNEAMHSQHIELRKQ